MLIESRSLCLVPFIGPFSASGALQFATSPMLLESSFVMFYVFFARSSLGTLLSDLVGQ